MGSIHTESAGRWKARKSDLPGDCLHLVNQEAIKTFDFEETCHHNSIWDMLVTSGDRVFFSLCAELSVSECAIFCEYDMLSNMVTQLFDSRRECLVPKRAIPPSKFHTGMCEMEDGTILMSTHTTSRGPSHPAWLLEGYWSHPQEGYVGSNLLTFDPKTHDVRNLGVPILRDSIYGGIYHAATNSYYFSTYLRGHVYHFDLNTRKVSDLGQASEVGSYRFLPAADGHIYGISRSGWIYRINTQLRKLEDTGSFVPGDPHPMSQMHRLEQSFAKGPDGRLYVAFHFQENIFAFDTKTKSLQPIGKYDPFPAGTGHLYRAIWGMSFDDEGVLWYTVATQLPWAGLFSHLCRWDITRGGKPEFMGCVGTPERIAGTISEIHCCKGRLVLADTNHGDDPPRVVQIDVAKLKAGGESHPLSDAHTAYFIKDGKSLLSHPSKNVWKRPAAFAKNIVKQFSIPEASAPSFRCDSLQIVRMWREVPVGDSCIHSLRWVSEDVIRGWCGSSELYRFDIKDGKVVELLKVGKYKPPVSRRIPRLPQNILKQIPGRSGRRHLNRLTACVPWGRGRLLGGTADGCMAIFKKSDSSVFSLGALGACGEIHDLSTNRKLTVAYGAMGDPDDLGMIFRYDDRNGLRELGRIKFQDTRPPWIVSSSQPCCVATHPDKDLLAIGTRDRMGCVYLASGICSER
jgi:hypothetical protein